MMEAARIKGINLSTERLELRRFREGDEVDIFEGYTGDESSSLYLQRPRHATVDHTHQVLKSWCDSKWDDESPQFAWILGCKETGKAIGMFFVFSGGHACEIHYGIGKSMRGKGLVAEAGRAIVDYLLTYPFIQRIWTVCDVDNQASRRVLEKLDFECEGILKSWLMMPAFGDKARDCYCFARTR
jgi:ribosomal-protein-alanine N-acetyltransferase